MIGNEILDGKRAAKAAAFMLMLCLLAGCGKQKEQQETLTEAAVSGTPAAAKEEADHSGSTAGEASAAGEGLGNQESSSGEVQTAGDAAGPGFSSAAENIPDSGEAKPGSAIVPPDALWNFAYPASAADGSSSSAAPEQAPSDDFEIAGDILIAYRGTAQHVVVPDGVKIIREKAFYNNSSLLSVVLPEGVTTIGEAAFNGCRLLEDISVPESLEIIESRAFSGCNALKQIDLSHVSEIGVHTFYKCHALTSAVLTELKKIGSSAFSNTSLATVSGMEYLEEIGNAVFLETPFQENYKKVYGTELLIRNHILIFANGCGKTLEIPQGVQVIASDAFRGEALDTLVIPESIRQICQDAFEGCRLRTVYLPQKDIVLGRNAFGRSLPKLEILPLSGETEPNPDFLIAGNVLLAYCGGGTELVIPDGVKEIGEGAFESNTEMESVRLPEGLTTIRAEAFLGCDNLKKVLVPASLSFIKWEAFRDCPVLEEIDLHNVKEIDENAFRGCKKLEIADLSCAETIGKKAFVFSGIKEVIGMNRVSIFGEDVFDSTPFWETDADMKIVGNVLLDGRKCTGDLVIPNGVEIIAGGAFEEAPITSVICPDTLREIGTEAFLNCKNLTKIYMSDSVVSLGENAFREDSSLSDVRLSKRLEEIPQAAFSGCSQLRMLTIPEGCKVDALFHFSEWLWEEERRFLTLPPSIKVPEFLKDSNKKNHKVYTTEIFSGSDWAEVSEQYGWSLSLLELAAGELTLWAGEEYLLTFNSGAKADWYSQDTAVVSVDSDGRLRAGRAGETDVTAEIYGKEYRCHVIVR